MAYTQMQLARTLAKETRLFMVRFFELLEAKGVVSKDELEEVLGVCELDADWLQSPLYIEEPDCPLGLLLGLDGHGPDDIQQRLARAEKRIEDREVEKGIQRSFWPGEAAG